MCMLNINQVDELLKIALGKADRGVTDGNEYSILKFKLLFGEKLITPYDIEDKVGIQYEATEKKDLIERFYYISELEKKFLIPPPPTKYSSLKNILDLGKKLGVVDYDERNEKSLVLKESWDKLEVKNMWIAIKTNPLGKMLVPTIAGKVGGENAESLNLTIAEILWVGLVLKKVRLINIFDLIEDCVDKIIVDYVDLSDKIIRSSTFLRHKYIHWGGGVQEIFFGYFVEKRDSEIILKTVPILPSGVMVI